MYTLPKQLCIVKNGQLQIVLYMFLFLIKYSPCILRKGVNNPTDTYA